MKKTEKYIVKNKKKLLKNAAECTLFLKKDGGFPLEKPCEIALFGSGARNTVKGGTGSGDVNCREYASIETALENAGFEVTARSWLDAYDIEKHRAETEFKERIINKAGGDRMALFIEAFGAIANESEYEIPLSREGDVCVYVLSRNSGEGHDRRLEKGNVLLTDTEVKDILFLNDNFNKFMLVLNVGGVVDLSPVTNVKNILLLSQLGVVTGEVFVDILLGKSYPSGKLATTWAKAEDYQTIGDFGDKNDTRYKEGIYVGYRYFDTVGKIPLYPFGFGLSYTEFKLRTLKVFNKKSKITVKAEVSNTGDFAGKETVQIYVTCPEGKTDKPYQTLAAFIKTKELKAGERQTVSLSFDMKDVAYYSEETASFVLDEGDYLIRTGNSSRDTSIASVVTLSRAVTVEKCKNSLGKPDFEDAVLKYNSIEDLSGVNIIQLSPEDFQTVEHDYIIDEHINPVVNKLPDEKLINMCIGAHLPEEKLSVLGSSAGHVCGASGETSNRIHDVTGGKWLVFADGPAGLRISAKYVDTPDGQRTIYENIQGLLTFLPKETLEGLLKKEDFKEEEIRLQNTTAIPIGTAIAQSWNTDFARMCGDIVGGECEIFKCHFWLAPAMNIHRSILCGRNFEYFSEDPVITGKIAAGVVKGLQSHKNKGAAIKHFCANNQERNRYNNNSVVSERALREIYLKGFEICVKEASPKAVMTSYNLLNGKHTSQREDLINGILRGEWGYRGFVITDWITTGSCFDPSSLHDTVYANRIINAGNDLVMPGNDRDFEDISAALEEGEITRRQIKICATRVYEAIMKNNR